MKRVRTILCAFVLMLAALVAGSFCIPSQSSYAASFTSETISVGSLSVSMTATARNLGSLERQDETGQTATGEEIDFLVFNWSELQSLKFAFTLSAGSYSYEFLVDYLVFDYTQFDGILPSISNNDERASLLQGEGRSTLYSTDFTFYVDSSSKTTLGLNSARGYDFGLYRFRISYTYQDVDGSSVSTSGEIYVVIAPDDVTTLEIPDGVQLLYSVSSANSLLNAYSFSVSSTCFQYCNPANLIWRVEGFDKMLTQYCYNLSMKEIEQYSELDCIWNSEGTATGTTFFFDSNGIEGQWTVSLYLIDGDGEILEAYNADVSTIKNDSNSTWWIVLSSVIGSFLVLGIVLIVLYYYRKRKEDKKEEGDW